MADKILDNLFLGDWEDGIRAKDLDRHSLCVIETLPDDRYLSMDYYVPILEHDEDSLAHYPHLASIFQLQKASSIISSYVRHKIDLLVHCYAGMERSPLTIAYWLVMTGRKENLDEAYSFLKSKRSVVEDRREWLPEGVLK